MYQGRSDVILKAFEYLIKLDNLFDNLLFQMVVTGLLAIGALLTYDPHRQVSMVRSYLDLQLHLTRVKFLRLSQLYRNINL